MCVELARRDLPDNSSWDIVSEVPFERTLEQCYRSGLKSGAKWTVTVDADVLVRSGAIGELIGAAESMPHTFFQVDGLVLDKIVGIHRPSGMRIYRTGVLGEALKHVPRAGARIRPESHVLNRMAKKGYLSRQVDISLGLHDFEQFHRDLYRKAVVHGRKHKYFSRKIIWSAAENMSAEEDFKVILRGFLDGLEYSGPVAIDRNLFDDMCAAALAELGVSEKSAIDDVQDRADNFAGRYASICAAHEDPPRFGHRDVTYGTPGALSRLATYVRMVTRSLPMRRIS